MSLTETAPAAEETPVSSEVLDLRAAVEKSKAAIAEKSEEIEAKKRKGGRPPGSRDKKPRKTKPGFSAEPARAENAPETPLHEGAIVDPFAGYTPSPFIPAIAAGLKVPFSNHAAKTGCEAVALSEEEAHAVALEIDKAAYVWMPDLMRIDPKVAVLLSAGVAIGGLALSKAMILEAWKKEKKTEAPPMKPTAPGESAFAVETAPSTPSGNANDGRPRVAPGGINGFEAGFAPPLAI